MQDSSKYLIHAQITANGVVERSDVVGAIFGQTEGLLGDELEIRELQESAKLGRIDVEIDSKGGQSVGEVTIASGLDRVETSILAASLETIDRVGPCRATFEVTDLEDVRQAKRREIVKRATELLERFDESVLSSQELVEEVRRQARVERITDFEGYPAGPRVADSDAIIVVEGRADVLQLLQFGIKNAIAVEGTNVPDAVARLTDERTVTAFLDGDRGGELILRELAQVGDVDYVAFAPDDKSVEDLSREEVMAALREKVAYEDALDGAAGKQSGDVDEQPTLADGASAQARTAADELAASSEADSRSESADDAESGDEDVEADESDVESLDDGETGVSADTDDTAEVEAGADEVSEGGTETDETSPDGAEAESTAAERERTLGDHVAHVIKNGSGRVRLLDDGLNPLDERDAGEVFDAVADAETTPATVVVDGSVDQRVLDVAAQRGVGQVIATEEGQFVKKPTSVRLRVVS
ncbi:DNA primase DnaG [Halapricum hydrolyticum]|uniref:DNA primase DnaG n=1 Tax=Halapricum hydrolyticum TaxID=2979991 RepID=A0AAE3I8N5_9EURY|nr:DNA primase DnaG [Halapricum hydrolyticum]MCU4716644.1 DNA primase DnaG [Halapricum hydrolyticum]MCU4725751.1 DNA primase DnaG [Halapricum hydrolyticum]